MRAFKWAFLVLILLAAGTAHATESTAARVAEQARLESGNDLSSRARRALFRARKLQDAADYAGAVDVLNQWLAGDPNRDHQLLRFNLAVSYFGLAEPDSALAQLARAVALAPRYARAWLRLGEAAYELGLYKKAGEAFAQAYDLGPERRPEILYYAGVSLLSGDEPDRALASLTRLLDTHAAEAELAWYQALTAAAVAAQQPARAVSYLDRLLGSQPDDPAVWDLAYRFYAGQSDYENAATMLTVADYLKTLSRAEAEQLGDLYAAIGVPLQAARYYERAFGGGAELEPSAYRKWATAWLSAHETAQARATLATALAAAPSRELWALRGDLEYMAEDYEAALQAFGAATRLDQDFGRGYLMMGYCAVELGRNEDARNYLRRAQDFAPQRQTASRLLAGLDTD